MTRKKPTTIALDRDVLRELSYVERLYRMSRSALVQMAIVEFLERHQGERDAQMVIDYGRE